MTWYFQTCSVSCKHTSNSSQSCPHKMDQYMHGKMVNGCFSISYCCQLSKLLRNTAINHISCTANSGCFSCSDLLTMVTFRKAVFMCTVSACFLMLYLGWKYHAMLDVSHHPSVCVSVCLCFSPPPPPPPLLPPSFASCHPVKVIAIY